MILTNGSSPERSTFKGMDEVRESAMEPAARSVRHELADKLAVALGRRGQARHVEGYLLGSGRVDGNSLRGNGDDRLVAVGYLAQATGELFAGVVGLIAQRQCYAASALARQLVEMEYLLWAFETEHGDATVWLNSSADERRKMWQPRHLRERSDGRFPAKDYSLHCETGGHPTPDGMVALLNDRDGLTGELVLNDALGHALRCWRSVLAFGPSTEADDDVERIAIRWRGTDRLTAAIEREAKVRADG